MISSVLIDTIVYGLMLGGIYALASAGLTLIWGVMDVINFAHAEFIMLAMYLAWLLAGFLDLLVALPIVFIIFFAIGIGVEYIIINRALRAGEVTTTLFSTFGLMIFLRNLALLVFGPFYRVLNNPYERVIFPIGGIRLNLPSLLTFVTVILMVTFSYILLMRTDAGIALRATIQDKETAASMGVNVGRIYSLTFGLGIAFAAIAGVLFAMQYYIFPDVGDLFIGVCFTIVVLGGFGNFIGSFFGGLIIGVSEALGALYVGPGYKEMISFVIFILVLLIKPTGLFGGARK